MHRTSLLLLLAALPTLALAGPAEQAGLTLPELSRLFRQRYAERAPGRADLEAASLRAAVAGGLRLDPKLDASAQRVPGEANETVSGSLSQGTPFGTEIAVTHARSRAEVVSPTTGTAGEVETKRSGVRLSQDLLRGGPWHGLAADTAADAGYALDELRAQITFEDTFLKAIEAFVTAQEAAASQRTAEVAQEGAARQHDAVKELVEAGYKPKADLLVSEAALLRSSLSLEQARQRTEATLRDLALTLWQRPDDPPLAVSQSPLDMAELKTLEAIPWPDEPPAARAARLGAERADAQADLASRDDLPRLAVSVATARVETDGAAAETQRTVGLSLSVPLVGAIRRDNAALSRITAEAARSEAAQARQAASLERVNLEKSLATAVVAHTVAEKLRALSEKTLEIERQKYADGKSSISEVRRVQEDLDRAALAVISARKDVILARLRYAKAAGALGRVLP